MNFKDIAENADRQMVFDTILDEACRQWCAFFPDTPERLDGEGFSNFFYEIFEQKESEYIQQAKESEVKKAASTVSKDLHNQQDGPLQENQVVQEYKQLLIENMPAKGKDYSMMLWQLDSMAQQLEKALNELQTVKQGLAQVQENPAKRTASRIVQGLEQKIHALQERLSDVKDTIVEHAKQAVESVKQTGISALDKTVSFLGIGKALNAIQNDLSRTMADTAKSIEKIETIGHELRSVGGHLKNAGRAAAGKEQHPVDGGKEGHFQSSILAPMRTTHKILSHINNTTLAAIGGVERLEQAANRNKEQPEADEPQPTEELDEESAQQRSGTIEKPSIIKDLREKKAAAAAHTAPVPEKAKTAEAAL